MSGIHTIPQPAAHPRAFLEYLYRSAVTRALPLHCMAEFLPSPPDPESGGRTLVLGAGKAGGACGPQAPPARPGSHRCADPLHSHLTSSTAAK
jgi:hypothetical protein